MVRFKAIVYIKKDDLINQKESIGNIKYIYFFLYNIISFEMVFLSFIEY